jgi:hypothetical protein
VVSLSDTAFLPRCPTWGFRPLSRSCTHLSFSVVSYCLSLVSPFSVSFGSSPNLDLCIEFIPRSLALALCSTHSVVTPDQAPLASRYGSRSQLLGSSFADKRIWCLSESVYTRPFTERDQHRLFLLFLFCSLVFNGFCDLYSRFLFSVVFSAQQYV